MEHAGNNLGEYPRPHMVRDSYLCLNGTWEYSFTHLKSEATHPRTSKALPIDDVDYAAVPRDFEGAIVVPFSPETRLSAVGRTLMPNEVLWYRKEVELPQNGTGKRMLLHFGAVDWECICFVNGMVVGDHRGGYEPFCFDITPALEEAPQHGRAEIVLCVTDPSDSGSQPTGKQKIEPYDLWYPAQSGIWQTVWVEFVARYHIEDVRHSADPDAGIVRESIRVSSPGSELRVTIRDTGVVVAEQVVVPGACELELTLAVSNPHRWSVRDPFLYDVDISYGDDHVRSYVAFRSVAIERDGHGTPRFCLSHEPLMLRGVLYQGYWPDSLMTQPSDAALVQDIASMRRLGFNMLRVHAKVECDRFYWHCDRLGMLVCQDQGVGDVESVHDYARDLRHLRARLRERSMHANAGSGRRVLLLSEFGGAVWNPEGRHSGRDSFGYATCESREAFAKAVRTSLSQAEELWGEGLAGFVYTQACDVEWERNGLLTYNRELVKLGE